MADGVPRRLISVSELQRLDKDKGEALIMHARQYPIITELADIDMYEGFKGYPTVPMQDIAIPKARVFSASALCEQVLTGQRVCPFGRAASGASLFADDDDDDDLF